MVISVMAAAMQLNLIAGREVKLRAEAYGTDCYPRRTYEQTITINGLLTNIFSPRNCYQNYNVATNCSDQTIYTIGGA